MLMASNMLMADDTLPRHLSFGLVDLNKFIVIDISVNIISVSCILQDNYSYMFETSQLFNIYE